MKASIRDTYLYFDVEGSSLVVEGDRESCPNYAGCSCNCEGFPSEIHHYSLNSSSMLLCQHNIQNQSVLLNWDDYVLAPADGLEDFEDIRESNH